MSCGCGKSTTGGCSCGSVATAPRTAAFDGAYLRPTFFAGQLLCEDDLEALTGYVRAKNRLHNRYLFGSGVVCGLHVACNPADPRSVTIASGYALGCGDDIVVPCLVEVDVIDLVAKLPAGSKCPDPCLKSDNKTDIKTGTDGTAVGVDYILGIEYAEAARDPALTYAVECGMQPSCEPTRVMEGFVFSLRCPLDKIVSDMKRGGSISLDLDANHLCEHATPDCPCDDDSFVPLALVAVVDCRVHTVCVSVRDFVITGPALRHWFNDLRHLEQRLQAHCCDPVVVIPPKPEPHPDPIGVVNLTPIDDQSAAPPKDPP
jgi:hypothetical protein